MQSPGWSYELTRQIGRGIDRARRGRSDQWIADRTAQLGHALSRTAVSEYRRGVRKSIAVPDWLVIAAALEVPPVTLLFPGLPNGRVVLLPHTVGPAAFDALQWVCGERGTYPEGADYPVTSDGGDVDVDDCPTWLEYRSLPDTSPESPYYKAPSKEFELLQACRELAGAYALVNGKMSSLLEAIQKSDRNTTNDIMKLITSVNSRVDDLLDQIEDLGGNTTDPDIAFGNVHDGEG